RPLAPIATTDQVLVLLAETQSATSEEALATMDPPLATWHEAAFLIPCSVNGRETTFGWITYKDWDLDHQVIQGAYQGLATKLAHFATTLPLSAQMLNREMKPGGIAQVFVSRFDERIITATFSCDRELAADDPLRGTAATLPSVVGVRHMPDFH